MSEKRDNSGALFKAKANENPKWPQYEGNAMIDGQEFWISAWVKEGKTGKFFSLAFKPKTERIVKGIRRDGASSAHADDDIPFN